MINKFAFKLKNKYLGYYDRFRSKARALNFAISPNDLYLKNLRSKHNGCPAFIIGNGPSLQVDDLTYISQTQAISFAANKIFLIFEESPFRPSYYFVEDDLVFKQNYNKICELGGFPKLFPRLAHAWGPRIDDSFYFQQLYQDNNRDDFPSIGTSPLSGFVCGRTVVFSMLQFAFYMQCNPIYLIGVDFSFELPSAPPNGIQLTGEGEVNHFHPDYRPVGEKWNLPDIPLQQRVFERVNEYAIRNNINVLNATRGGKLEVFPRVSLDAVFASLGSL